MIVGSNCVIYDTFKKKKRFEELFKKMFYTGKFNY